MARTVIDEIGVVAELETAPLFRGLELADDAIERFRVNSKVAVILDAKLDTAGLEQSIDQLPETHKSIEIPVKLVGGDEVKRQANEITSGISPAAFEAFSKAATQSFEQIAQSLNGLNSTIAQLSGSGLVGFIQGAAEEVQQFAVSSGLAAQAQAELAQRSLTAAEGFRAAGVAEADLNAQLERTGFLSEQAATELLKVAAVRQQIALEAGAGTSASALAVPTGFDKLIVDQQRAGAGARAMSEGFALAARQAKALSDATQAASTGSGRMAAGFAGAAAQARALREAEGGVADRVDEASHAFEGHGSSARKATNAITALAAGALQAEGPMARLAESALLFGGGEGLVAGVGIAVLAYAAAVRFATSAEREALDVREQSIKALQQEAETAIPATVRAVQALTAARLAEEESRKRFLTAQQDQATPTTSPNLILGIGAEIARREERARVEALKAERQAQEDVTQSVRAFQALNVQALTESISLHGADAEAIKRAQGFITLLQQQEQETSRTVAERLTLRQQEVALQQAVFAPTQARLNATRQGIADELAAQQQGSTAQQAALQAQFQSGLVKLEDFYRRRVQLARNAATAEKDALRGQQALLTVVPPGESAAAKATREAEITHLGRVIALRQGELDVQVQAIANERLINEALVLREQHLARIARAGGGNQAAGAGGVGIQQTPDQLLALAQDQLRQLEAGNLSLKVPIILQGAAAREQLDTFGGQLRQRRKEALELGGAVDDGAKAVGDLAHGLDAFERTRTGVDGVQRSVGGIGEAASRSISSIANLAGAIDHLIQSGASIGTIFGVIGAGVGALGALFGGDESEHDRVVKENTAAVRENTARQSDQFRGASGQLDLAQRVETALERFRAATEARTAAIEGLVQQGVDRTVAGTEVGATPSLTKFLRETGLSLEDLQQVADELVPGLQLVDKNGHLVADALAQLDKAVGESIKAQFRFSNSFDDQLRRTALESRLLIGRDQSPSEKFNQEVLAAGAAGASVIRDAFKGINLSDGVSPEEAAKVRDALKGLLLAFENGTLDLSKLGSLSADDLLKLLEDGADFLDTFNKEVQKATLAQVQSQETLRQHLFGTGKFDASAAFQAQVAGLAKLAPDVAKQFESLGAFGPEDQAAVRAILQQGFKNLIAGIIPEGLTAEEFQQFLEQGASFLDSFNDGLKGATDRLNDLNIPEGFRRAALAFQTGDRGPDTGTTPTRTDDGGQVRTDGLRLSEDALDPAAAQFTASVASSDLGVSLGEDFLDAVRKSGLPSDGAALPGLTDLLTSLRPVGDTLPRLTDVLDAQDDTLAKLVALLEGKADAAGSGAVPGASRAPEIHLTIAAGAIVVHAAPGQSASEIAGGVLTEFRRLAMLQTGDTLDTGSFT